MIDLKHCPICKLNIPGEQGEKNFCSRCGGPLVVGHDEEFDKAVPTDGLPEAAVAAAPATAPLSEAHLGGLCPSCNQANDPEEEFCFNCGTELDASTVLIEESIIPQPPLGPEEAEEYKFLTLPKIAMAVQASAATHVGLVKENNEDAVLLAQVEYPFHKIAIHVGIVADGIGGEDAGEVFAQLAVHEIWLGVRFLLPYFEQQEQFQKWEFWKYLNSQISNYLAAQITSANNRIVRYGKVKRLQSGSYGATIVVAVAICDLESGHIVIHGYNEGDARCVVVEGNKLIQISDDHTIAGAPYRFLGRREHVSGLQFKHEVWLSESEFSRFFLLLYSDGLWNMLMSREIADACNQEVNPAALAEYLIKDVALKVEEPAGRGFDERVQVGDDNITVVTMEFRNIDKIEEKETKNE